MISIRQGILLPESLLASSWFSLLAAFVAVNTVIYLVLSLSKVLPVVKLRSSRGRERRSETRNIDPDAPV